MGIIRKQPSVVVSASSPISPANSGPNTIASDPHTLSASFSKRKSMKGVSSSASSTSDVSSSALSVVTKTISTHSNSPINQQQQQQQQQQKSSMSKMMGPPLSQTTSRELIYSQNDSSLPLMDATRMGMGMGTVNGGAPETPKTPKTFKQSQDELFSKLNALAAAKVKSNPLENQKQTRPGMMVTRGSTQQSYNNNSNSSNNNNNNYNRFWNGGNNGNGSGNGFGAFESPSTSSYKFGNRRHSTNGPTTMNRNSASFSSVQERREPRRRINSAQFKTPAAVEMAELAKIVVANATPSKYQDKIRKRASTLSLTTTTFMAPGNQHPGTVAITPGGDQVEQDFRQKYDAAYKEAKHWEKKCSSIQNQLHYERERWEEKYGALEKAFKDLENSKEEANVEKMNSLLDTVQQLQLSNEVFRKQLMDAGIEPDPMPAAQFYPQHLLVDESLDRTFLEQDEVIKERSLITNKKIDHLSTELNNVAIAISQTINYVQLRYLTQMLDVAEHVTTQKRTRAMSNNFLSDMLSRGVKKPGPLQPKNTCSMATQTPPTILTSLQLEEQLKFQQQCMQQQLIHHQQTGGSLFGKSSSGKGFGFFNLGGHHNDDPLEGDILYTLKGGAFGDDRSQLYRLPIPPVVVLGLKGEPASPDSADILAANRGETPVPKFQYASPTTSQLRIIVPDDPLERKTTSNASDSIHHGIEGGEDAESHTTTNNNANSMPLILRRSSSEMSLTQLQQQQGLVKTGGKYPYPYPSSSRNSSRRNSMMIATDGLPRSMSQQFLSPDMAMMYNNSPATATAAVSNGSSSSITTNNNLLTASNIIS
ncbi:hypothetical protein BGZ46_004001 [Entomortierella lignicola]|nr:hypothetical protein BGZ46_004001 [Entomortierella lignicola]